MKNNNLIKYILFAFFSALLILIDQFTKKLAFNHLFGKAPITLINNILELVYVENRGAAFGILQNRQSFFYILTIIVLVILFLYLHSINLTNKHITSFVFVILLFSGAVGNFIDRVTNKYVIDFIYFKPIDFPVFNFADICITLGCIFMIIDLFVINKNDNNL